MEVSDIISIVGLAVKLLKIFVPLLNKKLKNQKNQIDNNSEFKDSGESQSRVDICIQGDGIKFTLNVKNPLPKDSLRNLEVKKLSENLNVINKNLREHVYQKHFID